MSLWGSVATFLGLAVDMYVATVLYDEWHSPCEYKLQFMILACILLGFPSTLLVEAVKTHMSFRKAFIVEILLMSIGLGLLVSSTKWVVDISPKATCSYTAPRLWNMLVVVVCVTWTAIIISAACLILATTVVLIYPPIKSGAVGRTTPPKFKTYYGTL